MTCKDLKYSKLKNLNEIGFVFERKYFEFNRNELQSLNRQILEDLLRSEQNVLSAFNYGIKEYFQQIKLQKEISTFYEQLTSVSQKHLELSKTLQTIKEEKEKKDSIRNIVLKYEQNLALRIELTKGEKAVSFAFHHVSESSPEETCSFVLTITDRNVYKVNNCHPPIAGMEELISTLNETNDLHNFIVNIRKKFKKSFVKSV